MDDIQLIMAKCNLFSIFYAYYSFLISILYIIFLILFISIFDFIYVYHNIRWWLSEKWKNSHWKDKWLSIEKDRRKGDLSHSSTNKKKKPQDK